MHPTDDGRERRARHLRGTVDLSVAACRCGHRGNTEHFTRALHMHMHMHVLNCTQFPPLRVESSVLKHPSPPRNDCYHLEMTLSSGCYLFSRMTVTVSSSCVTTSHVIMPLSALGLVLLARTQISPAGSMSPAVAPLLRHEHAIILVRVGPHRHGKHPRADQSPVDSSSGGSSAFKTTGLGVFFLPPFVSRFKGPQAQPKVPAACREEPRWPQLV